MLVWRLEVIYRTAQQVQSALLVLSCNRCTDVVEQLRDGVCNPVADQARLAKLLLRCLGGGDLLGVCVVNRRSGRGSRS